MALKRITALILAIVMTIGMFPVYTSAEEGASTAPTIVYDGTPETTTEPVCGICSQPGCNAEHIYCDACNTHDCGIDHSATAAANACKICGKDLCVCAPTSAPVTASAPAANSAAAASPYQANVGKRAQFDLTYTNFPIVSDPTIITAGTVFGTDISVSKDVIPADLIVRIAACYVNEAEGIYWYQIEAAEGYTIPAEFPADPWVFQNYVGSVGGESLIILEDPACDICGKTDCTGNHVKCDICGEYDCAALHFYCDICKVYDCGRDHLYCNLCEIYDCTHSHVWCGTCGSFDCGLEHEDLYTPVTAPVIPEDPTLLEGEEVSVVDAQGNPVEELLLQQGEKISLSAWSDLDETAGVSWQWQVHYDSARDLWVDIQGQTGKGLLVSPPMFLSILDAQGTAAVRCVVTAGEETRTSVVIPVTIAQQSAAFRASANSVLPLADTDDSGNLDKNYVVVQYVYEDGRTAAATDFAEIIPGNAYSHPYTLPVVTGYKATLKNAASFGDSVRIEDGVLNVNFAAGDLTEDYTIITVEYVPDFVNYTVIHYWQNINNDNYTEHEREPVSNTYRTGEVITGAHNTYPGFYNLLYETPAAAADGSTVIEVYYDRYYYLMKFELDGGYGVLPIYARYGTEIEIAAPTRPGYSFAGWTDENGNAVTIPDTVLVNGGTYYAKWDTQDTEYTVAYWIRNEDGSRVYVGSKIVEAESGAIVSGSDDLDVTTNTCGMPEHTHDACTMLCTLDEHTHGDGKCLYNCGIAYHDHTSGCNYDSCDEVVHTTHSRTCYNFTSSTISRNATNNINSNQTSGPYNGFTVYRTGNRYNYRYYVRIGGSYYEITEYSGTAPSEDDLAYALICHMHSSDCCSVTYHDHTGCTCNVVPHIHGASCYSCETLVHTHTEACKSDLAKYVDYIEADQNVTVKGDGSTVVNAYYEYRTYTIRFLYAKASGTGGSSYQIATVTGNGNLASSYYQGGPYWQNVSSSLPDFEDPSGETERSSVVINGTTYYYISLTAKFGADISKLWPSANIGPAGNYDWGSWAAAAGTGYRETYGDEHANIVGPYPVMSAEMIVDNPEKLADGTYLAQNMIAWWGGGGNDIEPHAYHIYFELLPKEAENESNIDATYNGKYYKLVETYTFTAAHNGDTRVDPIYFNGFECVNDSRDTNNDTQANSENFPSGNCTICAGNNCDYHNNFYYNRNMHKLYFWNHNGHLMAGAGSDVPYGASLVQHGQYVNEEFMKDHYPDGLEPGAFEFAGWYTTADCHDGTEMDWNSTMPDADMTVYAKWAPKHYTVNIYNDKKSDGTYGDLIMNSPHSVQHGEFLSDFVQDVIPEDPEDKQGFDFAGWFYLNEKGEEQAFDFDNIPVTRDLNIYAKWSSNKLCYYNVYFALDADGNGVADVDGNGNTIYIAAPISGSAIAGRTYTFTAKGGEELYDGYQQGYFPGTGSHSIVIDIADEDGTGANSFTFLYKPKAAVPYTVKYVDKDTGEELFEDKVVSENKNVVVTENFLYKQGYMPDAYQKTLVVSDDGVASNDVIIFYYTKDEQHALYVVNYYIQDLNADLNHAGWSKYTDLQYTGDIGNTYSAEAITIDGFTLSKADTDNYNVTQKKNGMDGTDLPTEVSALSDGKLSGTLGDKGMELNFYYTRNLYPYEFRYMLNGTTVQLAKPEQGKAPFDTVVTAAAKEIEMDLDGDGVNEDYRLYDPTETTKDIHIKVETGDTAMVNIATFYSVRCTQTMTITKTVVDNGTNIHPDPNQEFDFSLLIHAKNGYHRNSYTFEKGSTKGTLTPEASAPNTLHFSLKAGETITIEGLPTAEYTVSELNLPTGYYDTYFPAQKNKLTVDAQLDVTVTNTYDPATLTISKTVDSVENNLNTPEVTYFQFTIGFPQNVDPASKYSYTISSANGNGTQTISVADGKMTFTLQNGQTARFENLPTGQYTVEEADYQAQGYNSYISVNGVDYAEGRTAQAGLARGIATTVDFKNRFPVGDLQIDKTVTKEYYGTPWDGDTFSFTVERTTAGRPLISGNQYEVYVDDIKTDTNAVVAEDGTLVVRIPFDAVDAKTLETANAEVKHSLVIKDLPAGTYSVTEAEDTDYVQTPEGLAVTGLTLPAATTVKAEFTNQLIRPKGSLYLEKELVAASGFNPDALPQGTTFSFTVELKDVPPASAQITVSTNDAAATSATMTDGRFTVQLEAGQNVTVSGLPVGTYRITEATVPQYANAFAHEVDGEWVQQESTSTEDGSLYTEIQVTAGENAKVKCTNTYPVDRAELVIQKLVTKEYEGDTLPDDSFTFTVTLAEEDVPSYNYTVYAANGSKVSDNTATVTGNAFDLSLKAGQYAVVTNMPVCGYMVSEAVSTQHYTASYQIYLAETGETASTAVNTSGTPNTSGNGSSVTWTFSAGKTDTVVLTNIYKRHLTELTIQKTGAAEIDENQSFIFRVKSTNLTYMENDSAVDLRVIVKGNGSVTLSELPVGSYTITEESDWSWRYSFDGAEFGTVEFTANGMQLELNGESNLLIVENERANPYWLSGADAKKNIFDGTP